ncbi:MAG: DUF3097 family protein [Actinobacteria bacterium]|nr:DUF3097 family protein [Actinomycetota bacterium]MCB9388166.1 DUF3097 family protein [Acidimicrobiia bacterium]
MVRFPTGDILAEPPKPKGPSYPKVPAVPGTIVEHRRSGFQGIIIDTFDDGVTIKDRDGKQRILRMDPGAFRVDGQVVSIVPAPSRAQAAPVTTASGSTAVKDVKARVARASRIYVEGKHDAELVERVWGDDLRIEGIVVLPMDGADDLGLLVRKFQPGPGRRLGVLLDHLVSGSKESRIAAEIDNADVLITGHRFVDVWAAIRPDRVGLPPWPDVPRGTPWKEGVCQALGVADPASFWRHLLGRVSTYADLHPDLVGAVEQLIDFVTVPEG